MQSSEHWHKFKQDILLTINTCFPARIESFDESTGTATIQPLFKTKYYGQEPRTQPIIVGVPVLKQRYRVNGGTEQLYEPMLQTGDKVLCVCAQRSLDDVMSGQPYYAGKSRILDMQDAVIVGVM